MTYIQIHLNTKICVKNSKFRIKCGLKNLCIANARTKIFRYAHRLITADNIKM